MGAVGVDHGAVLAHHQDMVVVGAGGVAACPFDVVLGGEAGLVDHRLGYHDLAADQDGVADLGDGDNVTVLQANIADVVVVGHHQPTTGLDLARALDEVLDQLGLLGAALGLFTGTRWRTQVGHLQAAQALLEGLGLLLAHALALERDAAHCGHLLGHGNSVEQFAEAGVAWQRIARRPEVAALQLHDDGLAALVGAEQHLVAAIDALAGEVTQRVVLGERAITTGTAQQHVRDAAVEARQAGHLGAGELLPGELVAIFALDVADHGDGRAALLHHDGVAVAELRAGQLAVEQEVVEVDPGDGLAATHHADIAIAAQGVVDTAGLVEEVEQRVARGTGVAPGVLHVAGHEHTHRLYALQVGVDLHPLGVDRLDGRAHAAVQLPAVLALHLERPDGGNKDIAQGIHGDDLVELHRAPGAQGNLVAGLDGVAGIEAIGHGAAEAALEEVGAKRGQ